MPEGSAEKPDMSQAVVFCPHCMYDLRGLSGESCPECGGALDHEKLARSSLPWVHASFLMRLLPPVRTAARVTFRPRTFAQEMARPGDMRAARRFRRAVVWWVWLSLAVVWFMGVWGFELEMFELSAFDDIGWVSVISGHLDENDEHRIAFFKWFALGLGSLTWLYLFLVTGVHTYWFHPKRLPMALQERSLALSYYASAPLLLLGLPLGLMLAGFVFEQSDYADMMGYESDWVTASLVIGGFILLVLVLVLYLLRCVRYAGLLAQRSVLGQLGMAAALPMCWLGLAGLVFGVLPGLLFFLYVVFATL